MVFFIVFELHFLGKTDFFFKLPVIFRMTGYFSDSILTQFKKEISISPLYRLLWRLNLNLLEKPIYLGFPVFNRFLFYQL